MPEEIKTQQDPNITLEEAKACLADFIKMGTRPDKVAFYTGLIERLKAKA